MRISVALAALPIIAMACKAKPLGPTTGGTTSAAIAPAYPATRWVPAKPTYVLAATSVKAAQAGMRDVIDAVGVIGGLGVEEAGAWSRQVLSVNVFSPESVAAMGVDLDGGLAIFSEDINPTIVAHLTAPDQTATFFDDLRTRGMSTQSVIIDGTEVFTARLSADVRVSWAIAGDWLWAHFTFPVGKDTGTAWFHPKAPAPDGASAFATRWTWAAKASASLTAKGTPGVVGFADLPALVGKLAGRAGDGAACARLVAPVGGVAVGVESNGARTGGRIAFDVGTSAPAIQSHALAVSSGWDAAAQKAAFGVQWNLDVHAVMDWFGPCARLLDLERPLAKARDVGVRGGRAYFETVDIDDKSGRGAVAVDLTSRAYFDGLLDQIPLRSSLERAQTYGSLQGKQLSVPFGPTVDYVLTDKVAFAGMGEGLLAAAIGSGPARPASALATVDIVPPAMPEDQWKQLLQIVDFGRVDSVVSHMMRWQKGHIGLTIEGNSLVLEAHGIRR